MDLIAVPMSKGNWHKITSRVFWSTTDQGFMEFWLDDTVIESNGQTRYTARNCFNNAGNYLKIGLYRDKAIQSAAIVYYDNIKSGPTISYVP
jgi:hypothetical protein